MDASPAKFRLASSFSIATNTLAYSQKRFLREKKVFASSVLAFIHISVSLFGRLCDGQIFKCQINFPSSGACPIKLFTTVINSAAFVT
jgi:hypothetical protein